jgi:DNA-binding NarL/FixJ family response regulator
MSAPRLTERETIIAKLVESGLSNKQIARELDVSEGTVKAHLHNIYMKLGIANRRALIESRLLSNK